MNNWVKIFNLLNDTGMLGIIIVAFVGWFTRINPVLKHKAELQKTSHQREALLLLDQLAMNAVSELSTKYELPNDEKRQRAISQVTGQLEVFGHDIDSNLVSAGIEKAYQLLSTKNTVAQEKQAKYDDALASTEEVFAQKQVQLAANESEKGDNPAPLDVPNTTTPVEGGNV
ncbi:hypothetical protein [Levilactobacillus andaensis]|uniref:hypothetical protein n=1 Tax=Levilactobacillus andaensis TaxID=2799570 RepID=UPI001940D08E|nr:hypothetical protein [Levilactobacillus andaensis]